MEERINVAVNPEIKRKAVFVLKCKGKDLSKAVREMIEKYANEFDEMQKNSK